MSQMLDLEGHRFGRLVVTSLSHKKPRTTWNCLCDCGNTPKVTTSNLRTGHTQSCGCWMKERAAEASIKHAGRYLDEYPIWCAMKSRCSNPNNKDYKNYGGRGIIVEEPWFSDFSAFYEDMGKRPSNKHTIERVDVNGNYCKSNCIWTDDLSMQAFNQTQRVTNTSGRANVYWRKDRQHWFVNIRKDGVLHHFGSFAVYEDAVKCAEEAEMSLYGINRSFYK